MWTADNSEPACAANGEGPRFGIASVTAPDRAPLIIMDRHTERACEDIKGLCWTHVDT